MNPAGRSPRGRSLKAANISRVVQLAQVVYMFGTYRKGTVVSEIRVRELSPAGKSRIQ
jgi:hypothetical protein